ncbi:MAG: UDP-glucose 4-epimerase GalE [Firmicutes bacterium]|nr:UDP-glucose 4-epimerase GalE [Bacillota bacterium]
MVLVTGGAGYVGSHVVRELLRAGRRVVVYDNLSTGHRSLVEAQPPGIEVFIAGDVRDADLLSRVMQDYGVTAVVHLAASSLVGESMRNPSPAFENNMVGGVRLLEAIRRCGVKDIVFSSSAAVYGEPESIPIEENHPCRPVNPYGETKLFIERMLAWHAKAYGLRYISLRYFNAAGADEAGDIGEDHNPETHLIPLLMRAALGAIDKASIFGTDYPTKDGTAVRDFVHVSDLATAHVLALDALERGVTGPVNLGAETGNTVLEVLAACERAAGKRIPVEMAPRREGDPVALVASTRRAAEILSWKPQRPSLEDIVASAWKWHSRNPHGFAGKSRRP